MLNDPNDVEKDLKAALENGEHLSRSLLLNNVIERLQSDDIPVYEELSADNVVETIEAMVEGDIVLDDAATHHFFRDQLAAHRDRVIKMESIVAGMIGRVAAE